jgi:hypothetical protein
MLRPSEAEEPELERAPGRDNASSIPMAIPFSSTQQLQRDSHR